MEKRFSRKTALLRNKYYKNSKKYIFLVQDSEIAN